jgi:hypothetical protein
MDPAPPPALAAQSPDGAPDPRRATERWFIAQGVPHFIVDYSASHFVLTRAAPLLVAYLVGTTVLAMRFGASPLFNAAALALALTVVLGGWAALNVARGRPWRSLPSHVGRAEVAAFLLLPALPPLLLGLQWSDAAVAVAESAIFLAIVYLATSYGLVAVVRWAFRRLVQQRGNLGRLLTRALPLLMLFIVFTYIQSDTWALATAMGAGGVVLLLVLLSVLATLFMVGQLAPEVRRLSEGGAAWPEVLATAAETPAAPLCEMVRETQPRPVPMRWHEWVNVGVVVLFGQGLQVAFVTLTLMAGLLVFGVLLFPVTLQEAWAGAATPVLASVTLLDREFALTGALVTVSLVLGAISGLSFTISAMSDAAYRATFFSEADRELQRVFAVRSVYRAAIDGPAPDDPSLTPAAASLDPVV